MNHIQSVALQLSEAIAAADRLVTEHFETIDQIPEDSVLNGSPAATAVKLLATAISDADRTLTVLHDRLGSPEWLAEP